MRASVPLTQHVSAFFRVELNSARDVSPHTYKSYWVSIRFYNSFLVQRLKKPMRDICTDELTFESIYDWILYEQEKRNWGESTWNSRLAAIKTFVRYLARTDARYLDLASRTDLISAKKIITREPDFLTLEEFEEALGKIEGYKKVDFRDKLIFQILFFSGARVGELTNVKLQDIVRLDRTSVNLHFFGKGRKYRNVPLMEVSTNKNLKQHLDHVIKSGPKSEYLFCGRDGKKMSEENIRRIVKKHLLNAVKGKHVTPHTLRHSAAMNWLVCGMELNQLSILLGHENIQTTTRYLHSTFQLKADALIGAGQNKKLSQLFETDFNSNEDFWESIKVTI